MRGSPDLSDYDLARWRPGLNEFTAMLFGKEEQAFQRSQKQVVNLSGYKSRELYALITGVLYIKPNGMMTRLSQGKPMNNLWWWDFVITNNKTLLNVMCSNSRVEIGIYSHEDGFDLFEFLEFNMKKYRTLVESKILTFEVHDGYINHYQSYRRITKYLIGELEELDLTKPSIHRQVVADGESETLLRDVEKYHENSVKFHALGKSLILNCAFMAEAYVSLIARVGSRTYGAEERRIFKQFGKKNFEDRIRNLYQVCDAFVVEIDTSVQPIQKMLKVMTLRNKYAHADLSSQLNTLEPTYFDDDYPLLDSSNGNFIVDTIESAFHNPSLSTVLDSYKVADEFVAYIRSIIPTSKRQRFDDILELRVITRNRQTHRYSLIYHYEAPLVLMSAKSDDLSVQ